MTQHNQTLAGLLAKATAALETTESRLGTIVPSAYGCDVQNAVRAWKKWHSRMEAGKGKWMFEAQHREHELAVLAENLWNSVEIIEQWTDAEGWAEDGTHPMLPGQRRNERIQVAANLREVHTLLCALRNVARFVAEVVA